MEHFASVLFFCYPNTNFFSMNFLAFYCILSNVMKITVILIKFQKRY